MGLVDYKIPIANPLHFVPAVPAVLPQYNYKHFNDWPFPITIRFWETSVNWWQPWQKNDHIRLQLLSEVGPVVFSVVKHDADRNINDEVVFIDQLVQKQQSRFFPGLYIYELDLDLSIFDEGIYTIVLEYGTPVLARLRSNVFLIAEVIEDSILIEYKHYRAFGDLFFETGFSPSMRTYGTLEYNKPGSINVLFNDQRLNQTLISGKPYDTWTYYTGGPEGIPDFMVPKLNNIFCLNQVKIEGRYVTKEQEGTSFDSKEEADYPMRGWAINLRDKLNQTSLSYTADTDNPLPDPDTGEVPQSAAAGLVAAITVDTKGFVEDDNGGSFYNVPDIE